MIDCISPEGEWFSKNGKELKPEINRLLDKVRKIDRQLMKSREVAIGFLLAFTDQYGKEFEDFIKHV